MAKKSDALVKQNESTGLAATTQMGMGRLDAGDALAQMLERKTRILPKVHSLKDPGEYIDGVLLREGPPVECTRPDGEVVSIKTWVFEVGQRLQVALLSSYQLDHELPNLLGRRVRVTLGSMQNTRAGNRVKDFYIEVYDDAEVIEADVE